MRIRDETDTVDVARLGHDHGVAGRGADVGGVAGGVSAAEFTQAELFVGAGAVAAEVPVSPCAAVASKPRFIDAVRG